MDDIAKLVTWATAKKGVKLSGIEALSIPGRGTGFIATRDLKKGETIVTVPISAIRSLHTVPRSVALKLPEDVSVHCLVAADLCLGRGKIPEWYKLVPTYEEFAGCMPLSWCSELQALLPAEARSLLDKHQRRWNRDWAMVSTAYPQITRDLYLHAWYLASTRAFYYETDQTLKYPWHDRVAMLPLADLFNHSAKGCGAAFTTEHYTIVTDRKYVAGSEVTTSYGDHSNDYLLAEYGFILDENACDHICLDSVMMLRLTTEMKDALEEKDMLGEFLWHPSMKKTGKTWAALRMLYGADITSKGMRTLFKKGKDDSMKTLAKAEKLVKELVEEYLSEAKRMLQQAQNVGPDVGTEYQRSLLIRRWEQIVKIAEGKL